jgi:hypothetical protein
LEPGGTGSGLYLEPGKKKSGLYFCPERPDRIGA